MLRPFLVFGIDELTRKWTVQSYGQLIISTFCNASSISTILPAYILLAKNSNPTFRTPVAIRPNSHSQPNRISSISARKFSMKIHKLLLLTTLASSVAFAQNDQADKASKNSLIQTQHWRVLPSRCNTHLATTVNSIQGYSSLRCPFL